MQKTFLTALESCLFPQAKSLSFSKTFSYRYPKQPFSTTSTAHSCPAITYCPLKNNAVLLMSALNPYAVTPERRTDSKPFCRRFADKTGFDMSRRKFLQNHFRQSFESSPESRGSQTSGVLLVLFVQAKSTKNRSLSGNFRGFANLDYTLPSGSVKRLFLTVIRQYTSCTSA